MKIINAIIAFLYKAKPVIDAIVNVFLKLKPIIDPAIEFFKSILVLIGLLKKKPVDTSTNK